MKLQIVNAKTRVMTSSTEQLFCIFQNFGFNALNFRRHYFCFKNSEKSRILRFLKSIFVIELVVLYNIRILMKVYFVSL